MSIRLGLHISTSVDTAPASDRLSSSIRQIREAEAAGFDAAFVADPCHRALDPNDAMLAACATLGALATVTEQIQLGALVAGTTYRNPSLLASALTTFSAFSRGRAVLGMATGWCPPGRDRPTEHFEAQAKRFANFEQALQTIAPMIHNDMRTVSAQDRGSTDMATESLRQPPLLISACGGHNTIPLAVKHADHLNLTVGIDELPAMVGAIQRSCDEAGRDPETLETSALVSVRVVDRTRSKMLSDKTSQETLSDSVQFIADQVHSNILDIGIGGVILDVSDYAPGDLEQLSAALELTDAAWPLLWPEWQTVA